MLFTLIKNKLFYGIAVQTPFLEPLFLRVKYENCHNLLTLMSRAALRPHWAPGL